MPAGGYHREAGLIFRPASTLLDQFTSDERQQLAVERSKAVGLADLHAVVSAKTNPRDVTRCSLLEGLLYRLNPLGQGSASGQYTPGEGSFPLARIAVGQFVGRFGYSRDLADMEPVLFQPLLLNLPEPTDEEIM